MRTAVRPALATSETAVVRAVGYSLLAHALAYPDDSAIAALQEVAAAAASFLEGTPLAELVPLARAATPGDLEPAHVRLFSLSSSPDCPTYETAYFSPDPTQQTNRMADIAGFYRAFGVDTGGTGFRPDDICVELEFMGYLCRKQVYAAEHLGAPRVAQTLRAQRLFLGDHLGCWAAGLGRRIAARAGASEFYRVLGAVLEDWVWGDCRAAGVTRLEVVDGPRPGWESEGGETGELGINPEQLFDPEELPVM